MKVNKDLIQYIDEDIFPSYYKNDLGHNLEHIMYVINRSMKFAEEVPNINYDMVYTVAAYHDMGHYIDAKNHEKVSSELLLQDSRLRDFFTNEEIITMAEAVCDHRASLEYVPRSIYGKIVSSADRNTSINLPLKRTYSYRIKINPNAPLDQIIEESRQHLIEKFGKKGYANEKMYFIDLEYKQYLEDIIKLTSDKNLFIEKFLQANGLENTIMDINKGDIYKHFKGHIIQVIDIVYDSESPQDQLRKLVIYRQLNGDKLVWARPYEMFFEKVDHNKYPEINQEYRFEKYIRDYENEGLKAFLALKFYDGDVSKKLVDDITEALAKLNIHTFVAVRDIERYGEVKGLDMAHFMPKYAFPEMETSDIMIIEYSESGAGLGMCADHAYCNDIPLYLIAKKGSKISTTVNSVAEKVIFYDQVSDITKSFKELIDNNQLKTNPKTLKLKIN